MSTDKQIPPCPRNVAAPPLTRETTFGGPSPPTTQPQFTRSPQHHAGAVVGRTVPPDLYYPYDYDTCSCSSGSDSVRTNLRGPWCVCLVVCVVVATLTAGLGLPLALGSHRSENPSTEDRLQQVRRLLKNSPLIDGHNDLPWNLRKFLHNKLNDLNLSRISDEDPWSTSKWSHTDLPKLVEGGLGGQFWSAYVPCKAQHRDAVQITLEQIDAVERLVEREKDYMRMVRSAEEIRSAHRDGKIASLIGVEGGHALGNSLAVLRSFYNLGARYLTITHTCDTSWATGQDTVTSDGLSDFGKVVVREMNRLGMIVDLSHSSVYTARSAINVSSAPVIYSHSAAYSLCNSTRNVPDDLLKLVAQNGGLVMVDFYSYHVACSVNATMADVIRHINHIRKIAGVDHVGIGAGYDGINVTPVGLEDVSRYPYLLAELLGDPAWSERDLMSLAGLNFLRVFERVEEVRDRWRRAEIAPFEDLGPKSAVDECVSKNS
ncbi:dipeptidase 1-like isoform X2 [Sitophilus oryzae]|uniref:Dipeptidase n=1 Tax=Sitophilus oryzae TaxID=7048 RepID=A0A6J2YQ57_SITOR|nr:dipeptidase 1-like isoform X2 [Sitophilus oryzae]